MMLWRNKHIETPPFVELASEHSYGRAWYRESGESIEAYAASLQTTVKRVSDVVAILSPRVSVSMNVRYARSYLETGKAPGAMKARLAALARYESSGAFNGPKVNAFSRALQGDGDAVVVDAWMVRLFNMPSKGLTEKGYEHAASIVRGVAVELGWQASETQAALWCGARALVGYSDSYSPLLMGGA